MSLPTLHLTLLPKGRAAAAIRRGVELFKILISYGIQKKESMALPSWTGAYGA